MLTIDDLDETQRQAVERCVDVKQRVVPVTGQAGTGKTTIMRLVHQLLTASGYNVVLCAPTGKAAKRVSEATGLPAMTIHRLLEYPYPGERDPDTGKALAQGYPKRCRANPIDYDVVLADEYAMVNTEVHRNLIGALPAGGIIRSFGDINQLPPIESFNKGKANPKPSPFTEMLDRFKGIVLETIHRQGEGSGIVSNGHHILIGRMPKRLPDFTLKITDYPVKELRDFVLDEEEMDFSSVNDQIIVPTNKGKIGTIELNMTLQHLFQPQATRDGLLLPRHSWDKKKVYYIVPNDKVIWTQNNYDLGIFNGETGIVKEVTEFEEIVIDFGDRVVAVPPEVIIERPLNNGNVKTFTYDPRRDLDLAYVVTTHKAQGSEFDTVLYALNRSGMYTQSRHNFYTAVTRARKRVHVITDKFSLTYSVQHKRTVI